MHFTVITFKCTFRFNINLQSRSTSTPHRDRDCHPAEDQIRLCSSQTPISGLQSLPSGNLQEDYTLRNVIQSLNSLTSRTTAVLQWIPAHTGIYGNEVVNQLAKEGSKKQQPKSKLSYQEAKSLIRNKRLADFKHRNGDYNHQQDTIRLLSRNDQTMIFLLRTGHCRLRSHMKKIGIERSAFCPCGLEAQTTAHVLQSCPLHKRERESTWPTESSLGNKLHETATDLRLTVRFIALMELQK